MSQDHVALPKFIQRGFSIKDSVHVYDLIRNKDYGCPINRLGTESNYYDEDVEKEILSQGVELEFSKFYNIFCNMTDFDKMPIIIKDNINLITQFFSFMFSRAKKTLDIVNKESITVKMLGDISHSELLRLQLNIKTNPLEMAGQDYKIFPLVNFTGQSFINNSLGFSILVDKDSSYYSFFIPMRTDLGIFISSDEMIKDKDLLYIEPNGKHRVEKLNKSICELEIEYGNGFIFGESKDILFPYIEWIKDKKKIVKS